MVSAAELVCTVEKTRCPVIAASIAISSVSLSRISPTIIISGSCLSTDLSQEAKVKLISDLICDWLSQVILFSTGSSNVVIFTSTAFIFVNAAYSVDVFPDQVGHVVRIIPLGSWILRKTMDLFCPSSPSSSRAGIALDLSTIRITSFSHHTVGRVEARKSISLFV